MQISSTPSNTLININNHQKEATSSIAKIGSGKNEQLDDATLALIANALGSELSALGQGLENANDAISMMQIADGVLSGLSQSADDLNVLAVRGNNATLNGEQKAMLQDEAVTITESMRSSVDNASFNGQSIFGRELEFSLGVGSVSTNLPSIKIDSADLISQEGIAAFMETVHTAQSSVGSTSIQLESSTKSIFEHMEALAASKSQLSDTDMAKEATKYQQENMMLSTSMIAQSHQNNINTDRVRQLLS